MKECPVCNNTFKPVGKNIHCSPKCTLLGNIKKNDNGCWIWQKSSSKGYGNITTGNKFYQAHRLSYMIFKEKISKGMQVCHHCDEPLCINPDHLWIGTNKQNHQDKIRKGRAFDIRPVRASSQMMARGEKHGQSKLKNEQVEEIKNLLKKGLSILFISHKFNVSPGCINAIVKGVTWRHIN